MTLTPLTRWCRRHRLRCDGTAVGGAPLGPL